MISGAQTINQENHDFNKEVKNRYHFFKKAPRFKLKLKTSQINSNYQPSSLNANQEQLILQSSPNSISESQLFNLTDKELAVNYDWYDYNILHAFHPPLPYPRCCSPTRVTHRLGRAIIHHPPATAYHLRPRTCQCPASTRPRASSRRAHAPRPAARPTCPPVSSLTLVKTSWSTRAGPTDAFRPGLSGGGEGSDGEGGIGEEWGSERGWWCGGNGGMRMARLEWRLE